MSERTYNRGKLRCDDKFTSMECYVGYGIQRLSKEAASHGRTTSIDNSGVANNVVNDVLSVGSCM